MLPLLTSPFLLCFVLFCFGACYNSTHDACALCCPATSDCRPRPGRAAAAHAAHAASGPSPATGLACLALQNAPYAHTSNAAPCIDFRGRHRCVGRSSTRASLYHQELFCSCATIARLFVRAYRCVCVCVRACVSALACLPLLALSSCTREEHTVRLTLNSTWLQQSLPAYYRHTLSSTMHRHRCSTNKTCLSSSTCSSSSSSSSSSAATATRRTQAEAMPNRGSTSR